MEQTVRGMMENGPEFVVLLLAFLLAIFVVLVFAVRALMIARKLPVPTDPLQMVRPRPCRSLMLGASALLTPLVAGSFLPLEGLDRPSALLISYGIVIVLAMLLWLALEAFYRRRR